MSRGKFASRPKLKSNSMIESKYRIVNILREGYFSDIYKVTDATNNVYALKLQPLSEDLSKTELILSNTDHIFAKHFCKIIDKGDTSDFHYLVMTLVSFTLHDLRRRRKDRMFTLSTAVRAGIQCLESIESMHKIGFLHGDIRPSNFAIGRMESLEQKILFVLDFSNSRKYMNEETGTAKPPRERAKFGVTNRYAPLCLHMHVDLAAKDDIEAWFYQQISITRGKVPWEHETNRDTIGEFKENVRKSGHALRQKMFTSVPEEFETIFNYIVELDHYTAPDYRMLYLLLQLTMKKNEIADADAYDWETDSFGAFAKSGVSDEPTSKMKGKR